MFAERARTRLGIVAALVLGGIAIAPEVANRTGVSPLFGRSCTAAVPMTFVHVKWRDPAMTSALYVHGFHAMPMFALGAGDIDLDGDVDDVDRETDPRARWSRIEVPIEHADAFADQLADDRGVQYAFVAPEITLATIPASTGTSMPAGFRTLAIEDGKVIGALRPSADVELLLDAHAALSRLGVLAVDDDGESCPINTPSFESYQGYLGPAPHGIDAPAAWRRGHRGAGVWFADIEGGWNATHEDLPGDRIRHVAGTPIPDRMWRAHGTAVLGEVVGRDNGRGVMGIAPDVERVFTASIGGIDVADAIDRAARELRPGDVLLIELQGGGPRGRYLPVEYWPEVFETIQIHTKRGVVVIEAAGNGAEDLDHPAYRGAFDRKKHDSGAIMVGAGGPPREGFRDRERLDFSNYGGRVDVQGWGRKVATLDYGDLQSCDDDEANRHYTDEFSGTSSASPIVAGAAVILQGVARQQGRVLTPHELRDILRRTGTPQAGNDRQQIGPRPDLARAIREVERSR